MIARSSLTLGFAFTLFACGSSPSGSAPDAEVADAAPFMLCGNFLTEGDEACDDGNEEPGDGCSPTCGFECGDGVLAGAELCDPGIPAGDPGACPTEAECSDDDPCTTGVVSGAGCEVTCEFAVTTAPSEGDSCCPVGADATTDGDCAPICGNSVVEGTEACDTTIVAGMAGACPTACNDGQDCTTNILTAVGTCDALCSYPAITAIGPDDDCCPAGANAGTDPDCTTTCGDGAVTGVETCDTLIAAGVPGACPTSCNDNVACTTDTLVNAGTCRAACTFTPTAPGPADACCPLGADLGDDPDCPAACGDGVITPPETCDDNDADGGDGCSASCRIEPIAFRFRDMDLRDPHTFATVPILGCTDVTDLDLFGNKGVNPTLQINLQTDEDGDGNLDLSIANTFVPLVQTAGSTSGGDVVFPECTPPLATTTCELPAGAMHIPATATNMGSPAVCLAPVAGTTSGYSPALAIPTAPNNGTCYVMNAGTATFLIAGIPITLIDTRVAGVWFGSPATEIRNGMIRGFLTEATAEATIIPEDTTGIDSIDGSPLASLLRGGVGSCSQASPLLGNKDTYTPPGGLEVSGWYFYLNFTAVRVPYTEL